MDRLRSVWTDNRFDGVSKSTAYGVRDARRRPLSGRSLQITTSEAYEAMTRTVKGSFAPYFLNGGVLIFDFYFLLGLNQGGGANELLTNKIENCR